MHYLLEMCITFGDALYDTREYAQCSPTQDKDRETAHSWRALDRV
jgi:hypothetical protein